MTAKLTTVRRPKNDYSWPTEGLVQLGPATDTFTGPRHQVFLDGEEIGYVEAYQSRPSEKVTGTRLRRELPPRQAWRAELKADPRSPLGRISYTARMKAVRELLTSHVSHTA